MGLSFILRYEKQVVEKDIPALPKNIKTRVQNAIQEKLTYHPETFGKPLRRSLKGYRRLHVGEYRVIFRIEKSVVKIFVIGHRSAVYEDYVKRLL